MSQRPTGRKATGDLGERLACQALVLRGYDIVVRNWRCREGEVDIIARDGDVWVFVEVKTRHGRAGGLPEEGLSSRQANGLVELAQVYLGQEELSDVSWRIELAAIELGPRDQVTRMNIVPHIGVN